MNELKKIDEYLEKLKQDLENYGICSHQKILENIKKQMYSVIQVWNDLEIRNGILLFSMEIAEYFKPDANLYHKAFVVTTIRNSLIESAGSDFYSNYGFERQLSDEEIKRITSFAISYFKKFSFQNACLEMKDLTFSNIYLETAKKYNLTWEIVKKLGLLKGKEQYFEPISIEEKEKMLLYAASPIVNNENNYVVEDGMNLEINQTLYEMLEMAVTHKDIGFFTDSFKFLSRNFEKVLKCMQYVLERDSKFVTFNYYISNGYISKRQKLLKPAHKVQEIEQKMKNTYQITSKHKNAIELIKTLNEKSI